MPQSWEARLNPLLFVGYSGAEGSARSAWSQIVSPASIRSLGAADMDVQGLGAAYGLSPLRPVTGQPVGRPATIAAPQLSPQDEVQISSAAKLLDQASQVGDLRSERLAQIRAEIANGTYDTDEKLEAALGRLINSLGQDLD